jgi:hypothetical protein
MSLVFTASRFRAVGVACAVALLSGCGPEFTTVSGKVTHKGRPVVYGTVTAIGSDQATYYATIQLDGTYSVPGVPVGPAKFAVYSPDPYFEMPLPPAVKGAGGGGAARRRDHAAAAAAEGEMVPHPSEVHRPRRIGPGGRPRRPDRGCSTSAWSDRGAAVGVGAGQGRAVQTGLGAPRARGRPAPRSPQ